MERGRIIQLRQILEQRCAAKLANEKPPDLEDGNYRVSTDGDLPWFDIKIENNEVIFHDGSREPLETISNYVIIAGESHNCLPPR